MVASRNTVRILFVLAAIALASPPASAELIGQWLFDNQDLIETSGFKPGVHNGEVATGSVVYSTDTPLGAGHSLDLTGGNNAVRIINSNQKIGGSQNLGDNLSYQGTYDADIASSSFTVAAWVQGWPVGDDWQPFVAMNGENAGWQLRRYSNTDNATMTIRGLTGAGDPQGSINANTAGWHYIVGVYDAAADTRTLYVDGVKDAGGSIGGDGGSVSVASWEYLVFGARDTGGAPNDFAQVKLDDVRIYNHAVSAATVAAQASGAFEVGADDRLAGIGELTGGTTAGLKVRMNNAYNAFPNPVTIDQAEQDFFAKEFKADAVVIASHLNYGAGADGFVGGDSPMPHDQGGDDNVMEASGVLRVDSPGTWVFGVQSDDGFRLRLGNSLTTVAEFTTVTGGSNTFVQLNFEKAGYYAYRLTYFERDGGQHLEFFGKQGTNDFYQLGDALVGDTANGGLEAIANGQFKVRVVNAATETIDSLAKAQALIGHQYAVSGEYFGYASTIDFWDGSGGTGHFGGNAAFLGGSFEDFVLEATGKFLVTESSTYTFGTNIDDGAALWIDGQIVINADRLGGPADFFGQIFLAAGVHDLRYLFFEQGGGAEAELFVAKGAFGSFDATHFELLNDIGEGSLAVFSVIPAPAALPAGLALMTLIAARRRRC